MKKTGRLLLTAAILCMGILTSCGSDSMGSKAGMPEQPDLSVIQNICNLSTLECYFHNVAKADKDSYVDGTIFDFLKRDRKLWIEYNGIVKIGIDGSQVKVEATDNGIEITIPEAKILSVTYDDDSLNSAKIYASEDDWFAPNIITAEIQSEAVKYAQNQMAMEVNNNEQLMKNAQIRAQVLIKNYIEKLAAAEGKDLSITWKYEDGSTSTQLPEAEEDFEETVE